MHLYQRVQHWIVWWLSAGLILGAMGWVSILNHHLARPQEELTAAFCALFWLLSGVVCYAVDDAAHHKR
ncbi:MAG TPA: hypothetical protein VGN17_21210 [Bryobacteraceae bacterium]|jgi:hypothetical protein